RRFLRGPGRGSFRGGASRRGGRGDRLWAGSRRTRGGAFRFGDQPWTIVARAFVRASAGSRCKVVVRACSREDQLPALGSRVRPRGAGAPTAASAATKPIHTSTVGRCVGEVSPAASANASRSVSIGLTPTSTRWPIHTVGRPTSPALFTRRI